MWRWKVRIKFELRDFWIGLYWDIDMYGAWSIYVCPVPLFPIKFYQVRK